MVNPKCRAIRFRSPGVYVGVMVLQQLAQDKQSVSAHTSFSVLSIMACNPRTGFFSSRVRKRRKVERWWRTLALKERSSCASGFFMGRKYNHSNRLNLYKRFKRMRLIGLFLLFAFAQCCLPSCQGSGGEATFCDTTCNNDTIAFTGSHATKPAVSISMAGCLPDSIQWYHAEMAAYTKTGFAYLIGQPVRINKDFVGAKFKDNLYVWLLFNDCITGRGFQLKLPYDKKEKLSIKSSGVNSFDPKFSIAEQLIVNTDRGNLFVEDAYTGKKAMMTFGEKLPIDYDRLHDHLDSVHVTDTRIWVRFKSKDKWVEKEKNIVLE